MRRLFKLTEIDQSLFRVQCTRIRPLQSRDRDSRPPLGGWPLPVVPNRPSESFEPNLKPSASARPSLRAADRRAQLLGPLRVAAAANQASDSERQRATGYDRPGSSPARSERKREWAEGLTPGPIWPRGPAPRQYPGSHCQYPIRAWSQNRAARVSPRGAQAVRRTSVPQQHSQYPSRARVRVAPSESVPHGTQAVSTPCPGPALGWPHPTVASPASPGHQRPLPPSPSCEPCEFPRSQRHPRRETAAPPTARPYHQPATARPSALHRATQSAMSRSRPRPAPPPLGASGTGPQVGLGAERRGGGDRIIYCPIAWLPPGCDPGAG